MKPIYTIKVSLFLSLTFLSVSSIAGMCGTYWDGDKVTSLAQGKTLAQQIRLNDFKGNQLAQVTVAQIKAFHEAKDRIQKVTGLTPQFIICDDQSPNAFVTKAKEGGDMLGVTVGMMKMVNGDIDMAAAIIGHEYAHSTRGHLFGAQVRNVVLDVLGAIAGAAIDVAMQDKYGVSGFGQNLGSLSTSLVARKFDRDQEREADEDGFNYMLRAGFNPTGAVRLVEKFKQLGVSSGGLFFDSHPGWDERGEAIKAMLSSNPEALRLAALTSPPTAPSNSNGKSKTEPIQLALVPVFEATDAYKAYVEGLEALRRGDLELTIKQMKSAALAGHAGAQIFMGFGLEKGRNGLVRDEVEAVRFYRLAADQGNTIAQSLLGSMYDRGRGDLDRDFNQALKYYRLSAEQGDPQGQALLGSLYERGLGGFEKNEIEAARLYKLSAEKKSSVGQALLGAMYERGVDGLLVDKVEAARLYKLSADQGNSQGQVLLGSMYERGLGNLSKDLIEAAKLYQLSANQGYSSGLASLGRMHELGIGGLPKNEVEATRLYKLSAGQGNSLGQVLLGTMYARGIGGLSADNVEAVRLYKLSADQGDSLGQVFLGVKYLTGSGGLTKDESEGVRLFKVSAQKNNLLAKNNLGVAYEFGQGGLSKDIETAVQYYKEASELGCAEAVINLKRLGR